MKGECTSKKVGMTKNWDSPGLLKLLAVVPFADYSTCLTHFTRIALYHVFSVGTSLSTPRSGLTKHESRNTISK